MNSLDEIIGHIELHSAEGLRKCFENGVNPNALFRGEPLIYELTSEYTRSPQFKDCVRTFVEFGLDFKDRGLLAVLLNDASILRRELQKDPRLVSKKYTLRCAYTPLYDATLLHIAAEFNHTSCADILVQGGADVNGKAGIDEAGFGGQTPIFHTVNQNRNQSLDMLNFLLARSADLAITVPGILWGKGYEWETLIPSVNPISYTMMGLLPQMHRDEMIISEIVTTLVRHAYGIDYTQKNVPNAYLRR